MASSHKYTCWCQCSSQWSNTTMKDGLSNVGRLGSVTSTCLIGLWHWSVHHLSTQANTRPSAATGWKFLAEEKQPTSQNYQDSYQRSHQIWQIMNPGLMNNAEGNQEWISMVAYKKKKKSCPHPHTGRQFLRLPPSKETSDKWSTEPNCDLAGKKGWFFQDKSNTLYEINLLNHGAKRTVLCYARVTNHYIMETSDAYDFLCVLRAFRNS